MTRLGIPVCGKKAPCVLSSLLPCRFCSIVCGSCDRAQHSAGTFHPSHTHSRTPHFHNLCRGRQARTLFGPRAPLFMHRPVLLLPIINAHHSAHHTTYTQTPSLGPQAYHRGDCNKNVYSSRHVHESRRGTSSCIRRAVVIYANPNPLTTLFPFPSSSTTTAPPPRAPTPARPRRNGTTLRQVRCVFSCPCPVWRGIPS